MYFFKKKFSIILFLYSQTLGILATEIEDVRLRQASEALSIDRLCDGRNEPRQPPRSVKGKGYISTHLLY